MTGPRIVVIGGGVSGLATAGLLARGGARVTLLERHDQLGGRSGRFEAEGHTFDTGPSWYLMGEAFEQFFSLMGRRVEDELDLIDLDPRYRVFFEAEEPWSPAEVLDVTTDPERNWAEFERLSPGEGAAMEAYADEASDLYRTALDRFLYTTFKQPQRSLDADVIRRLPRLGPLLAQSLGSRISARVQDPRLRQILGFHAVFLGSTPERAPALFSLMSHLDLVDGVRYPRGGMYAIIEALARVAGEEGAVLRTGATVARILVGPDSHATGVELADGEVIEADAVVGATDLHHVETALVPATHQTHPPRTWKRRSPGVSALLAMVGVEGELPQLAHHNLFFTRDWDRHFSATQGTIAPPVPGSVYVSRATATEPHLAPDGRESLFLLVPFPANPELGADEPSRQRLEEIARRYLGQVATWACIPRLEARSTVLKLVTPADFASEMGAWQGGALGLEHTLMQSALFRPGNVSRKIPNLLYAGASTVPGIGVPLCLISAELVAKRLLGAVDAQALPTPAPTGFLARSRASGTLGAVARGEHA